MIKMLSDLNLVERLDFTSEDVIDSGVAGSWVTFTSTGTVRLTDGTEDGLAFPVFTESNRDGTVGFTPDTGFTKKVTILFGKVRVLTDQYTGAPSLGDALTLSSAGNGRLATATVGTDHVVAFVAKAPHTITHLSTSYTVIEIVTI